MLVIKEVVIMSKNMSSNNIPMKRLNIILVDDERHVLEEMRDTFELHGYNQLFKINVCSSVVDALSCATKCDKNKEEIALLVTDIKMKDYDGFNLIHIFKEFYPLARSIVLTGYAEEERAIEAFNDDLIRGFFKKPWSDINEEEIIKKINTCLKEYFAETEYDAFLRFDLLTSKNDLKKYFRERYRTWLQEGWIERNKREIDIDYYDFFSEFMGCFADSISGTQLIGGLRIIYTDRKSSLESMIEEIIKEKPYSLHRSKTHVIAESGDVIAEYNITDLVSESFAQLVSSDELTAEEGKILSQQLSSQSWTTAAEELKQVFHEPKFTIDKDNLTLKVHKVIYKEIECVLPAWKVHNSNGELDAFYKNLCEQGRSLVEISRLFIDNDYRGIYKGMIIAGILNIVTAGYVISEGISDAIACSNPTDKRAFYKRMAALEIPGTKVEQYYDNAPSVLSHFEQHTLLNDEPANINPVVRERLKAYLKKWELKKSSDDYVVCSCPNEKICIKRNYFLPVTKPIRGYHCPLRVKKYLEREN